MAIKLIDKQIKTNNKISIELIFQLGLTLFALYIANRISIDVWRSIRGH